MACSKHNYKGDEPCRICGGRDGSLPGSAWAWRAVGIVLAILGMFLVVGIVSTFLEIMGDLGWL